MEGKLCFEDWDRRAKYKIINDGRIVITLEIYSSLLSHRNQNCDARIPFANSI